MKRARLGGVSRLPGNRPVDPVELRMQIDVIRLRTGEAPESARKRASGARQFAKGNSTLFSEAWSETGRTRAQKN